MSTRLRTIVSILAVLAALSVIGVVAMTQLQRPETAQASPPESANLPRGGAPLTFDTFRDIARSASPGVVNINTEKIVKRPAIPDAFREFFGDQWFGPQGGRGEKQKQMSLGSGFVIDKAGYILTNRHVIDGADEIKVLFPNKKTYEAKLVGKDARTDVALIKIEPREALTVLPLGDSDRAEVGEWVMAIGSPFQMAGTVTVGVVSYQGRQVGLQSQSTSIDMIQTDAAINPGNSGGPLINSRGEVIGINTLIMTQGVAQSSGVGFAVPVNVAKGILPQLKEKGSVTRGWLGVVIRDMNEELAKTYGLKEAKGAAVTEVQEGSPAEKAGVLAEDVILGVDGSEVGDSSDLVNHVTARPPGSTVKLHILRGGAEKLVSVTLGTFPEEGERAEGSEGGKGRLGMTYRDLSPGLAERLELPRGLRGVLVTSVEPGEAADEATLQSNDVIVSVNSQSVDGVSALEAALDKARPAGSARLRVLRGNTAFIFVIKLE